MIIWRDPARGRAAHAAAAARSRSARSTACTSATRRCCALVHDLARARGLDARPCSPSTGIRPRSCGPGRRRSCSRRSTRSSSCSKRPARSTSASCSPFDEARSKEPAEDFVSEVLAGVLGTRLVVVGADFHFGYRRHGDVAAAASAWAPSSASRCSGSGSSRRPSRKTRPTAACRTRRPGRASCSRAATSSARPRSSAGPHEVRGRVERGDQRGRELGFPTANVAVPERICLPADGVYAGTYVGEDGVERLGRDLARPAADVLRGVGHAAARGVPARLRRRPLRPAAPGCGSGAGCGARSGSNPSTS